MKIITYILLLISILVAPTISFCNSSIIQFDEKVPIELALLIQNIEKDRPSPDQVNTFLSSLNNLNNSLNTLSTAQLLFLIKSEIYQTLLKVNWNNFIPPGKSTISPIDQYQRILEIKLPELNPLTQLIFQYIIKDLQTILSNKDVNNNKKIKMISPWLYVLKNTSPDKINNFLSPIYFNILLSLESKSTTFMGLTEIKNNNTIFFKFDESILKKTFEEKIDPQQEVIDLKNKSLKEKQDAEKLIKEMTIESVEVQNNKLEEKSKNKTWVPKE